MCRDRKRRVTLISGAAHPDTINTVYTYCYGTGDELRVVPGEGRPHGPGSPASDVGGGDVSGVRISSSPTSSVSWRTRKRWVRSSIRGALCIFWG